MLGGFTARLVITGGRAGGLIPPDAPWDSAPAGVSFDTVTSTSDGRRLTVAFVGSKENAEVPCGADYTAEAVTGAHAVVVMIHARFHQGNDTCDLIGYGRQAEVTLDPPLGNRVVLEGTVGRPVAVTRA
jgi:hypothetical protein